VRLISLQQKLIKIGTRIVRHARAFAFQQAKVTVTGQWSGPYLRRSDVSECHRYACGAETDWGQTKAGRCVCRARRKRGCLTGMMHIRRSGRPLSAVRA
jgi:hypothetical protein